MSQHEASSPHVSPPFSVSPYPSHLSNPPSATSPRRSRRKKRVAIDNGGSPNRPGPTTVPSGQARGEPGGAAPGARAELEPGGGFLTLVVSGAILLALTGLTLTGSVMGLVFFGPVILLSSPIWVPVAAALFVLAAGSLCACGAAVALVAGATWTYRYFTGRHPVGSGRVDYARSRIADTASHVKDYARDYGGYLQNRTKDAPGA
uniref:Oleosin 1-like n=1 Tax=Ananas comosus var. bracteatus TaxID=296719 RepID=A0A6V7PTY3_ANACO|nr:unnamed protein product [Ananas comosus var. bracteatus]